MTRSTNRILAIAALGEAATGLALVVVPSAVVDLLLRARLTGAGFAITRIAGVALIALGVACWPSHVRRPALDGMLTYSAPVAMYLLYLGLHGDRVGVLLWPAVAIHVILTVLLARMWLRAWGDRLLS